MMWWLALRWGVTGVLALLALLGIAYQLAAAWAVRRFFAAPVESEGATSAEAITLMKPLHGAEPRLAANLASFLHQDYPGAVQMVCGVNTAEDAAVGVVAAVRAAHRAADIALSTGPIPPAANGKIANLAAMLPLAKHDVLILSDSDMVVGADYLARVTAALAPADVGAVSCLFVGRGDAGRWSRLGAGIISFYGTPNVVFALHHRLARPCMGATIALRRATLRAIGGFARFADVLADDYALGEAVAELGLKVAVPPLLLTHAGAEASLPELWRHFLRWAVTLRDINPAGHYGAVITQPLPCALVLAGFAPLPGLEMALAALAARLAVALAMRRAAGRVCAPLWTVPVGDCLGFAIFIASLVARRIDWRGQALTIGTRGRITAGKMEHP